MTNKDIEAAVQLSIRREALCASAPTCPHCGAVQVQLVNWTDDISWKCRKCKLDFCGRTINARTLDPIYHTKKHVEDMGGIKGLAEEGETWFIEALAYDILGNVVSYCYRGEVIGQGPTSIKGEQMVIVLEVNDLKRIGLVELTECDGKLYITQLAVHDKLVNNLELIRNLAIMAVRQIAKDRHTQLTLPYHARTETVTYDIRTMEVL